MANFNDLAIELQEAIWELVLPTRGVHWIEVEGIPQDPEYVRASIRMAEWHQFDRMPETRDDVYNTMSKNRKWRKRAKTREGVSTPFFMRLFTTVPAVFGRPGPDQNDDDNDDNDTDAPGHHDRKHLPRDQADEIAYTRRCRQLSTYTQISTLLSTCRLSRLVAQRRIRGDNNCSWPLHRSLGPLCRPRPMEVWEAQYGGDKAPLVPSDCDMEVLAPRIRALDLVVFRLYDSHGRATPLMRHAAWQYAMEVLHHPTTFGCFERVGIEWHPSWGTMGGRGELRSGNFEAIVKLMGYCHFPTFLYWLVDGVPRPDWKRDYPAVIVDIFAEAMAKKEENIPWHLSSHWGISEQEGGAMLSDHHLDQEFEANGRRYYVVFVVFRSLVDLKRRLNKAGVVCRGPFPGGADLWPEAIREPVRLAHDVTRDDTGHMGTMQSCSYILSWEPI